MIAEIDIEDKISISKIYYADFELNLNKPIILTQTYEDDLFYLSEDNLEILVWGSTVEEVKSAFNFAFIAMYNNYALEIDENLTTDAIALKNKILDLIKCD